MARSATWLLGPLVVLASLGVLADVLIGGSSLPRMQLPDQHGTLQTLDDARTIVFAPDREASEIAHPVFEASSTDLDERGVAYVTDISAMPGFVTRMFALPKMRDYPYTVLLGKEPADTAMLPRQEGRLTVLRMADGQVSDVDYVDSSQGLAEVLAD